MEPENLLAFVTADEPPMTLTSEMMLAMGARRRRTRVLASTGGGVTLTALALVAVLTYAPLSGGAPQQPGAAVSQIDCLRLVPIHGTPTGEPAVEVSAGATAGPTRQPGQPHTPAPEAELAQVACATVDGVLGMRPDVEFAPTDYQGVPAFQAVDLTTAIRSAARCASGSVRVTVTRRDPADPIPTEQDIRDQDPGEHTTGLQYERLSDGTVVVAYAQAPEAFGAVAVRYVTASVWTARTHIEVTSDNTTSLTPVAIGSPTPLLTQEQVKALALLPQLAVFG